MSWPSSKPHFSCLGLLLLSTHRPPPELPPLPARPPQPVQPPMKLRPALFPLQPLRDWIPSIRDSVPCLSPRHHRVASPTFGGVPVRNQDKGWASWDRSDRPSMSQPCVGPVCTPWAPFLLSRILRGGLQANQLESPWCLCLCLCDCVSGGAQEGSPTIRGAIEKLFLTS